MGRIKKVLSSPVLTLFLIIVISFGSIKYVSLSNEFNRELGNQIYSQLNDAWSLTRFIEMKLEVDGPDGINDDLLTHVNHLVYVSCRPIRMFEHFLQDVYQPLLRKLGSVKDENEKEQLVDAVRLFHDDLREIVEFAIKSCQIVLDTHEDGNPKVIAGDNIRYARLSNPNSKLYSEFNDLIQKKITENIERINSIS